MKKVIIILSLVILLMYAIPTVTLFLFEKNVQKKEDTIEITESTDSIISVEDSQEHFIDVYSVNNNEVFSIELEEYIMGVVAGEMPASFEIEALKAQAVTSRTYLIYKLKKNTENPEQHKDAPICTGTHCQVYYSKDELIEKFGQSWYDTYWAKIENAVNATKGQILTYEGKIIEPLFHSTSGGRTENSEDVFTTFAPYLRSVESPYESNSPKLNATVKIPVSEFIEKLEGALGETGITVQNLKSKIALLEVSEGGKVKSMQIGDSIITGREFRTLYNLNSANFKFVQSGDNIEIITTGYGHGVGMSQYGANGMAIEGYNYQDILKHYYSCVEIMKYN